MQAGRQALCIDRDIETYICECSSQCSTMKAPTKDDDVEAEEADEEEEEEEVEAAAFVRKEEENELRRQQLTKRRNVIIFSYLFLKHFFTHIVFLYIYIFM